MSRLKRIILVGTLVLLLAPVFVIRYQDRMYTKLNYVQTFGAISSDRSSVRNIKGAVYHDDGMPRRRMLHQETIKRLMEEFDEEREETSVVKLINVEDNDEDVDDSLSVNSQINKDVNTANTGDKQNDLNSEGEADDILVDANEGESVDVHAEADERKSDEITKGISDTNKNKGFGDFQYELQVNSSTNYGHKGESNLRKRNGREHNFPDPPTFGRRRQTLPYPQNTMQTFKSISESLTQSMNMLRSSANFVSRKSNPMDKRIILIFIKPWYIPILQRVNFQRCKAKNCILTQERSTIRQASAVIFNHFEIKGGPPPKPKDQIWIFHTEEPPFYTKTDHHRAWQEMFNYTMTYRRDSDFSDAYGRLERRKTPLRRDYNRIFKEKRAEVAMFESNCGAPSRRKEYVKMLMRYIRVDVYGQCGKFKCGRRDFYSVDKCHEKVGREYKFYLVFENSICNDYTTEKFYTLFETKYPIIPVVRGAQNILEYVPSKLFINTYDFKHPKDLAMYLIQLGNNKERYTNFLKTMDGYSSPSHAQIFQESMCKLCSLLNSPITSSKTVDVFRWTWDKQCPVVESAGVIDEKFRKKTK